jgi:hypothetical protein
MPLSIKVVNAAAPPMQLKMQLPRRVLIRAGERN